MTPYSPGHSFCSLVSYSFFFFSLLVIHCLHDHKTLEWSRAHFLDLCLSYLNPFTWWYHPVLWLYEQSASDSKICICNLDLPLNSRPVYPTAFSVFLLDIKWASQSYYVQMKTLALLIPIYFSTVFIVYINNNSISQCLRPRSLKVILQSSFFFTSISNPIENYLGSSVYLHKEARQYLIIRLGQSYVGNFPMPSSFTQIISLYYDLQNIIKSGCPLSLPLIP